MSLEPIAAPTLLTQFSDDAYAHAAEFVTSDASAHPYAWLKDLLTSFRLRTRLFVSAEHFELEVAKVHILVSHINSSQAKALIADCLQDYVAVLQDLCYQKKLIAEHTLTHWLNIPWPQAENTNEVMIRYEDMDFGTHVLKAQSESGRDARQLQFAQRWQRCHQMTAIRGPDDTGLQAISRSSPSVPVSSSSHADDHPGAVIAGWTSELVRDPSVPPLSQAGPSAYNNNTAYDGLHVATSPIRHATWQDLRPHSIVPKLPSRKNRVPAHNLCPQCREDCDGSCDRLRSLPTSPASPQAKELLQLGMRVLEAREELQGELEMMSNYAAAQEMDHFSAGMRAFYHAVLHPDEHSSVGKALEDVEKLMLGVSLREVDPSYDPKCREPLGEYQGLK